MQKNTFEEEAVLRQTGMGEMMITEELIEEIKDKIVSSISPDKIILFGSQATGEAKKESDIDLVIIWDTAESQHRRNLIVRRLFPGRNFSLDVFVFTPKEERELRDIRGTILYTAFKNGKIIYEKSKGRNSS
ncbi:MULTISPECIES: nucleotidyltransferase domain-containing protein [Thermodesulfovibrio]|uniref:nucleotidyltransferase domain-containing protein n=1 Tax=Thermodesulfovibrio TaxID=28261 RepID=UPI0026382502|nr:nucleotidyltransferase domain-containing protein [Thermodesulfovibrio sp.]